MVNSVAAAKLDADKNSCDGGPDDIELMMKGICEAYTVDENGEPVDPIETYMMAAYRAYYSCQACGKTWDITELGQALAWEAVQEHLDG